MIPYGKQNISESDIQSVMEVLRSDFLTQGPVVPKFEKSIASYCNAKYATAVNSATSALHIACLALGVGPGDLVWTTPITFVASANCARYCGADIDFVDIDEKTFNISVDSLEKKLISTTRVPKVLIPVHMTGQSCDMARIHALAKKYGFHVIEDASHAVGASYLNSKVGSCEYSDITVFSFHPVKIITTGEGGVALTNDGNLAKTMARLRSHGITRYPSDMTRPSEGEWYYQQLELGFNYRLTDLQAALGLSQLTRLDEFVKERNKLAKRYDDLLKNYPVTTPYQHPDVISSRHLYIIQLPDDNSSLANRKETYDRMKSAGIGVNVHYIPVYHQPYYKNLGFLAENFPAAEKYYRRALTLPLYPGLKEDQQDFIVSTLTKSSGYQTIF